MKNILQRRVEEEEEEEGKGEEQGKGPLKIPFWPRYYIGCVCLDTSLFSISNNRKDGSRVLPE